MSTKTERQDWEITVKQIYKEYGKEDKKFYKWLLTRDYMGRKQMTGLLWRRAYSIWDNINNKDRDHFAVISGEEGSGKSTLSMPLASAIDPTWNLDRLCYKPDQFIELIEYSKKGDAIVLDEGNLFLFSREAMSGGNKIMVKLFALMRQRNLCVIINVPNFWTVDSYVRDHRTRSLFYIPKRGQTTCFVGKAIPIISYVGKKTKSVTGVKVPQSTYFRGCFSKKLPKVVSEDEYRKHKAEHFQDFLKDIKEGIKVEERKPEAKLIRLTEAVKIVKGVGRDTIRNQVIQGEIRGKKLAGIWYVDKEDLLDIKSPKVTS
jgi:hypothetical protein